jgi:hypothetical protein
MKNHGFQIVKEEDITDKVIPTLELAQSLYEDVVNPAFRFLFGLFQQKYPKTYWLTIQILKKASKDDMEKMLILNNQESRKIINPTEFKNNKKYMIFLL